MYQTEPTKHAFIIPHAKYDRRTGKFEGTLCHAPLRVDWKKAIDFAQDATATIIHEAILMHFPADMSPATCDYVLPYGLGIYDHLSGPFFYVQTPMSQSGHDEDVIPGRCIGNGVPVDTSPGQDGHRTYIVRIYAGPGI